MANQRIIVTCQSCGDSKVLAKRLMSAFRTIPGASLSDWDVWFQKHEWGFCGDKLAGLDIFAFEYEHDRDWESSAVYSTRNT